MTVSLPKPLREFVAVRVRGGGFGSVSDYIRDLIRRDQRDADRAAFERTVAAAAADKAGALRSIPPMVWLEVRSSLARGEELLHADRLREAIDLMQTGLLLTRERLRREFPGDTEADLDRRLATWLHDQGQPQPDSPFRPVSDDRLRRILGG
ncbi:MAG: hypothetical protein IPK26_26765 [Planctomycetes bacterium]|nr:hypothetical protein [Planctomycetota bacterium]